MPLGEIRGIAPDVPGRGQAAAGQLFRWALRASGPGHRRTRQIPSITKGRFRLTESEYPIYGTPINPLSPAKRISQTAGFRYPGDKRIVNRGCGQRIGIFCRIRCRQERVAGHDRPQNRGRCKRDCPDRRARPRSQ